MTGVVEKTTVFHWKVEAFSSLVDRVDSPRFLFGGRSWELILYPDGCILLFLRSCDSGPSIKTGYSAGIRTAKGETKVYESGTVTFGPSLLAPSLIMYLWRAELLRRRDELLPQDVLTITLTLKPEDGSSETILKDVYVQATIENKVADVSVQTAVEESEFLQDAYVQATVESEVADVSVQATVESKVADVSVQTAVEESLSCGGKGELSEKTGTEKVLEDVANLWPNGDHTDVLLKIKNVEFKVHRTILAARIPVLGAMFHHDTAEKASGEVSIDDCEPEVFEQLLHYIYRGAPRDLTAENASSLYVLADKYLVSELKALCVRCMRDTLCLDTFCDTLTLSLMHREKELLKSATDFLSTNMINVMKTVEWQTFMHQHTTWGNEIMIRAMELDQSRR